MRLLRRIEYLIPISPSTTPTTQVQIIFAADPAASATTAAATQASVPAEIKATTDEIFVRSTLLISLGHPKSLDPSLPVLQEQR